MKKYITLAMMLFLVACSGSSYQSVGDNKVASTFSPTDQKMLVDELSKKLMEDGSFRAEIGNSRPTILIDTIKNKTSEHIDTESITDTLKSTIVRGRLFRVINRDKLDILAKEQELNQSGLTDSQSAARLGKLWGAQYVLYGNFSSIVNFVGKQKQTYYKFTLIVQNIETGEEIWIDESEINKITKKGLF